MTTERAFVFAFCSLLISIGLLAAASLRGEPQVVETSLDRMPMDFLGMKGVSDHLDPSINEHLDADQHVYRHYIGADAGIITLYIGYYGTAKGGRTGHNPYACLPGAGWGILERGQVEVITAYSPKPAEINYVVSAKDGLTKVMLHWYQSSGDRILATGLEQNIHRFFGRVLRNRNDGAYVQISTLQEDQNLTRTLKKLSSFAQEVLNLLPANWPKEA